jgi:glucose-6-phosphate isomerase
VTGLAAEDPLRLLRRWRCVASELGVIVDLGRAGLEDGDVHAMSPACRAALEAMDALEQGCLANPDEGRAVGHYWLRAPERAPSAALGSAIRGALDDVDAFARRVHDGSLRGADGRFEHVVHIGIGGSSLGGQLLCEATSTGRDALVVHFMDNADPDGVTRTLSRLAGALGRTLVSVVSKSGLTPTPIHVAGAVEAAYARAGLRFADHAVTTTMPGTPLDRRAAADGWLARFPLWDWVGGRTSVTSAVGLLPAALQGVDIHAFLAGAAAMDELTRGTDPAANPAALLAIAWHRLGDGSGRRSMVVLPYRDRLALLPRYVQQLVMESVGKRFDRSGNVVRQGLTVYGNKGTTDQHAYMQQLREGPDDFFVLFVGVHRDAGDPIEIGGGVTLGDYLFASLGGTRDALHDDGRRSITVELTDASPRSQGALIGLLERAVGLYAELIDVNAYHQPSVDKHAAGETLALQQAAVLLLAEASEPRTAVQIARDIGRPERADVVFRALERLARLPGRGVVASDGEDPASTRFTLAQPTGARVGTTAEEGA